jgi:hypothetical protein
MFRRVAILVALLPTLALAGCGGSTHAAAPRVKVTVTRTVTHVVSSPVTQSSAPAATSDDLPVVECPTTTDVPGVPTSAYPDTMALAASSALAARLAYYSDADRSLPPILAPRGWACRVTVGADGSTSIYAFPPGGSPTGAQAVTAYSPSACQDCVDLVVCALIPYAARQLGYASFPCTPARPPTESVDWLNGSPSAPSSYENDVVSFEDPSASIHRSG